MEIDYTQALKELVEAIKSQKPQVPQWLAVLIAATLGVGLNQGIEILKTRRNIKRLERRLLREVHQNINWVKHTIDMLGTTNNPSVCHDFLDKRLQFRIFESVDGDTYMRLKNSKEFDTVYTIFRLLPVPHDNLEGNMRFVVDAVKQHLPETE